MTRRITAVALIAVTALAVAACGKANNNSSGGASGKTLVVGVDLPFQGASSDTSNATFNAMQLYLDQVEGKAGNFTITLKKYDDSTAAKGAWDDATCAKNANDHVANADEVAVMGTYNSGCAKLEVPVLNQAPNGPMLMVSHANTNPGLTKTWDPGEPASTTRPARATTPASSPPTTTRARRRAASRPEPQGQERASSSTTTRPTVRVSRRRSPTRRQEGHQDRRQRRRGTPSSRTTPRCSRSIKAKNPDCIFLGGIYDNNGGQLIKDKVAVLGDNTKVKLMAPDGFTGYPDCRKAGAGQGDVPHLRRSSTDAALGRHRSAAGEVPRRLQGEVRQGAATRATRSTACRRCRSSWQRSRSPTAPARSVNEPGVQRCGYRHPGRPVRARQGDQDRPEDG